MDQAPGRSFGTSWATAATMATGEIAFFRADPRTRRTPWIQGSLDLPRFGDHGGQILDLALDGVRLRVATHATAAAIVRVDGELPGQQRSQAANVVEPGVAAGGIMISAGPLPDRSRRSGFRRPTARSPLCLHDHPSGRCRLRGRPAATRQLIARVRIDRSSTWRSSTATVRSGTCRRSGGGRSSQR